MSVRLLDSLRPCRKLGAALPNMDGDVEAEEEGVVPFNKSCSHVISIAELGDGIPPHSLTVDRDGAIFFTDWR